VEVWFNDSVSQRFGLMKHELKDKTSKVSPIKTVYRFGKEVVLMGDRVRILKKVQSYNHHYIVHSAGVKKFLGRFVSEEKITVFPFAITSI
jgi:hypothetical protein